MLELWADLTPLILASAALPLQTILTLRLVHSSRASAFAWVAGMTAVRLIQGLLFKFVFSINEKNAESSPQVLLGSFLLIMALLLYVKAFRRAAGAEDEDAPPPQWLEKASSMSPLAAFGAGAGFMTLSAKFLVFTLGAVTAIEETHLGVGNSVLVFVLFVLLAEIAPLAILALSISPSTRSDAILQSFSAWLQRSGRAITIIFGLIFGTWFLLKALKQLGVI